jgi:hypothetical protein
LPSWVLKAAAQKILSALPAPHLLGGVLQTRVTGSLSLTRERVASQMGRCARHLEAYAATRGRIPPRVLEVGTGWHPLLPVGFHLCGCGEILSLDRTALLTRKRIGETLRAVAGALADGTLGPILPRLDSARTERFVARFRNPARREAEDALGSLGIRCEVGEASGVPAESADLVVTNSVLEHLREEELRSLLGDLRRAVALGGAASHFIDLGDHYATFDSRIDVFNFLRFSDRAWSLVNSRVHWQSRLRISDYRRLLAETGWILREEESQRGTVSDLARIPVAPRFTRYSLEDLLVYRSWVRAEPDPRSSRAAGTAAS